MRWLLIYLKGDMSMKTDVGSIVRTIVFILAWVNQF